MVLRNKNVVITGASRGLGAALARALGVVDARLVLVARERGPLEEVVASIRARGGAAHAFPADVSHAQSAHAIAGAAAALVGPVDILIHNASTLGPVPLLPLLDTPPEQLEQALATNLVGPFRLTRAVAATMALRGGGIVVHITSDAATNAYPTWGAYGISKAALEHLTRIWAAELPEVRFLAVDPGEMDTRMHADAMPEADRASLVDPVVVAARIVTLLEHVEGIASGTRVAA
jgi:NAD(P)-dependent dehydrogenase (short-subunit alcohol dehydrogenase family)